VSSSDELAIKNTENAESLALWLSEIGLAPIAATLIESFGSLSALMAQLVYVGQPMLQGWVSDEKLTGLAQLLEDEQKSVDLAARLRAGSQ
jgi:hypothetical protein